MLYLFLAEGFEEIEALTVVDILRRGGVELLTVSITEENVVQGAHDIPVISDITMEDMEEDVECLILPGGMPGTKHLHHSKKLKKVLDKAFEEGKILAAICAAPVVFEDYGYLNGKEVTCFPDYEPEMKSCRYTGEGVCVSGNIITAKGAGTAHRFGFALLERLKDGQTAQKVKRSMQYE